MNLGSTRKILKWISGIILIVAVILIIQSESSIKTKLDDLNRKDLLTQNQYSGMEQQLFQISSLLERISGLLNKHILALSANDKSNFSNRINSYQNKLLNTIYDLEGKLDEDQIQIMDEIKNDVALYITNDMIVQDYSNRGLKKKAWGFIQDSLEQNFNSALTNIDKLNQQLSDSKDRELAKLKGDIAGVEAKADFTLKVAYMLILFSIAGFLFSFFMPSRGKANQRQRDNKRIKTKNRVDSTERNSQTIEGSATVETNYSKSNKIAANVINKPSQDSIQEELRQQNEIAKQRKKMLNEVDKLTSYDTKRDKPSLDFGTYFKNSNKVSELLKSAGELSSSSIVEAQDIALKIAKMGEYEIRKLASYTIKMSRDVQKIIDKNNSALLNNLKNAENTSAELQNIVKNIGRIENLLTGIEGTEDIINSLDNMTVKIGGLNQIKKKHSFEGLTNELKATFQDIENGELEGEETSLNNYEEESIQPSIPDDIDIVTANTSLESLSEEDVSENSTGEEETIENTKSDNASDDLEQDKASSNDGNIGDTPKNAEPQKDQENDVQILSDKELEEALNGIEPPNGITDKVPDNEGNNIKDITDNIDKQADEELMADKD